MMGAALLPLYHSLWSWTFLYSDTLDFCFLAQYYSNTNHVTVSLFVTFNTCLLLCHNIHVPLWALLFPHTWTHEISHWTLSKFQNLFRNREVVITSNSCLIEPQTVLSRSLNSTCKQPCFNITCTLCFTTYILLSQSWTQRCLEQQYRYQYIAQMNNTDAIGQYTLQATCHTLIISCSEYHF